MTLGFLAAVLCLLLVLAGTSMGVAGAFVAAQPSPSGSEPGGAEPTVFLVNPNATGIASASVREPSADGPPPTEDPQEPQYPRISDKFDGVDEAYHVVAVVNNAPSDAIVEAYFQPDAPSDTTEITIDTMAPVPGSQNAYETYWEIPEHPFFGFGTFRVRLYDQRPDGVIEVAADEVRVRVQQRTSDGFGFPEGPGGPPIDPVNEPRVPEAETVEILWPEPSGSLGFFKGGFQGALWRTWINGLASPALGESTSTGADDIRLLYSVSKPGDPVEFIECGGAGTSTGGPGGAETWGGQCALTGTHVPSRVTAIAAVARQNQSRSGDAPQYSMESADAHTVEPYLQTVDQMTVTLESSVAGGHSLRKRREADSGCLTFVARVFDQLERPVRGANLDVHIQGPNDQVEHADDQTTASERSSGFAAPDKAHSSSELGRSCDDTSVKRGLQGDDNVPAGNDFKHRESTAGSGSSAGAGVGGSGWRFYLYSTDPGITNVTAWVDEEPVEGEGKREVDNDLREPNEAFATNIAQWLSGPITVTIDPAGKTAAAGTCQRYVVKVRDGARPVPQANVDVHATGPTNDLDFCNPGDESPHAAPNQGTGHQPEDQGEAAHTGQPPVAQHTEGVADANGNFVIGLISPTVGDTTITAWHDGEETFDNDDFAAAEPSGSATTNWITSTGDAAISFLNPSAYFGPETLAGDGTRVGKKQDVDSAFHLVARVASIEAVPGVEFFYQSGDAPLVKIADGSLVGGNETYEAYWPVDVPDGAYTLVARILGTQTLVEQDVTVNNSPTPTNPRDVPFETAEITSPLNGQRAAFVNRRLAVKGVASAGAEGVDLFYTRASAITTPGSDDWIFCGYAALPSGTTPKEFNGECELQGPDQPGQVTGVAVAPFDCVQDGCNGAPGAAEGLRHPGENDSGDAHRIFGGEANPLLAIEPAETAATVGACQRFVITLEDQTRQPIPGQNVDVHLTSPDNSGNFCSPTDGTGTERRAPDQGSHVTDGTGGYHDDGGARTHHTESETTGNGRFILGIESATAGDAQLNAWVDSNDNDVPDEGEVTDVSIMHWESDGICDVTGTDGPDTLTGGAASERICGLGGNDTIRGGGGNDVIIGAGGRDSLRGGPGNDVIRAGSGNDTAMGGGGADRVNGGRGADRIKGNAANDRLRGNAGNDRLGGGAGRDNCVGGGGRDRLRRCEGGSRSFAARPYRI